VAKKLPIFRGFAVYPHLQTPDTKFNAEGVYHTKVRPRSAAEGVAFKKVLDDAITASYDAAHKTLSETLAKDTKDAKIRKALKSLKKCDDAPYSENEDGTIEFNFKMKATGKNTKTGEVFTRKPALFDAALKPITTKIRLGGGSEIAVSYRIDPFYTAKLGAGVSLKLFAVQVIKLVEFGGDGAYYGFTAEENESGAEETAAGDTSGEDSNDDANEDENEDF
jgi:hypothetical protein